MPVKSPNVDLKATDKTGPAFKSAQSNMRNLASSAAVLEGPLGGIAGRMNAIGAALGRVSPLTLAAGVGLSALSVGFYKATAAAIEFETQMLTLEGIVRATGASAGFTAEGLNAIAETVARDTLASTQDARKATTILAQFQNIQGETLRKALELAEDVSATYGVGLVRSAQLVGRALNNPNLGLEALNSKLQVFTREELNAVREAETLSEILDVQSQIFDKSSKITGAAARQAEGAAGAWDSLGQSIEDLYKILGAPGASIAADVGRALQGGVDDAVDEVTILGQIWDKYTKSTLETHSAHAKSAAVLKEQIELMLDAKDALNDRKIKEDEVAAAIKAQNDYTRDALDNAKFLNNQAKERLKLEKEFSALQTSTLDPSGKLGAKFAKGVGTAQRTGANEKEINDVIVALRTQFFEDLDALDEDDIQSQERARARRVDIERSLTDEKGRIDINAREMALNLAVEQIFSEEETQRRIIQIYQNAADQKGVIDERAVKKRQAIEEKATDNSISAAGNIAKALQVSNAISYNTFKHFAVLEAVANTAVGVTRALSTANFPLAAAIGAAGAVQVATIVQSSESGATPSAPSLNPVVPGRPDQPITEAGPVVTVNVYGNFYGNDSFDDLIKESVVENIKSKNINLTTDSGETIRTAP